LNSRRVSAGMTILPRSSIFRAMPESMESPSLSTDHVVC
jgi:hypothetical protein